MASVPTPKMSPRQTTGKSAIPGGGEKITWFKPLSPEEDRNQGFSFLKLFRWNSSSEVNSNSSSPRRGQSPAFSQQASPSRGQSPAVSQQASPSRGQSQESSRASSRNQSPLPEAGEPVAKGTASTEVTAEPSQGSCLPSISKHIDGDLNGDEEDIDDDDDDDDDEVWTEVNKQDSWKGMPTRSLTSILSHLSKIIERRGQTPQAYRDSDFKQYWMPDSQCKECYECGDKFTTFRRRHHCRVCGQIFCSRCCNQEVPGRVMGYTGYLRVCTSCCKVVLSYAQSNDQNDLKALQEDLKSVTESALSSVTSLSLDILSPKVKEDLRYRRRTYSSSSIDSSIIAAARNPFEVSNFTSSTETENSRHVVEHERQLLLKDSIQLRDLWLLMLQQGNGIEFESHRYRLRTYPDCIVGSQVVDWLLNTDKATDRVQAVAIGQALVDAKWIECVTRNEQLFRDEYALYRPGEAAKQGNFPAEALAPDQISVSNEDLMEPIWFREITDEDAKDFGTSDSHCDLEKSTTTLSSSYGSFHVFSLSGDQPSAKSQFRKSLRSNSLERSEIAGETSAGPWELVFHQHAVPNDSNGHLTTDVLLGVHQLNQVTTNDPQGWLDVEDLNNENGEKMAMERLSSANYKHLVALLDQLLESENLPHHWSQIILPMVEKISKVVKPDVRYQNDEMDIRHYVHIKKVAGGSLADCRIVNGVICTKNVAHRKMRTAIKEPRILILKSAVEHQRVEHKFSSIEPIVLQEHEYLKNYVHKISTLKPTILIVEKSVARLAQDFLLNCDITVVLNVKSSVVARIGRFTEGDLVTTVDQASKSSIGFCRSFNIQQFKLPQDYTKTLMFFEGCPSNLGCSVILRGAHQFELTKVKKVFQLMLFAAYHSRLEMSFLMDEFAMPPEIPQYRDITPTSPRHRSLGFSDSILEGLMKISEGEQNDETDEGFENIEIVGNGTEKGMATIEKTLEPDTDKSAQPVSNFQSAVNSMKKIFGSGSKEKQNHSNIDTDTTGEMDTGMKISEDGTSSFPNPSATVDLDTIDDANEECKINDLEVSSTGNRGNLSLSGVQGYSSPKQQRVSHSPIDNIGQLHHFDREGVDGSSVLNPDKKTKNYDSELSMEDYIAEFHDTVDSDGDVEGEQEWENGLTVSSSEKLDAEANSDDESIFSQALKETILNSSPFMKIPLPYLETAHGKASKLREHFPEDLYWSPKLLPQDARDVPQPFPSEVLYKSVDRSSKRWTSISVQDPHPFLTQQLTFDAAEDSTRTILADYRARGSRIQQKREGTPDLMDEYPLKTPMTAIVCPARPIDCFDPKYHQKITLQFSSYSSQSYNAPNYCVSPWTVSMDFYGKNDIPLGLFLERYCFRNSYKCPSEMCDASMVDHVRRFVHSNAAIQILQRQLDQPIPGFKDSILSWSWCRKCKQVTPVQPLSSDTWSMSFGKYLELRFYGMDYNRRACSEPCHHSLHRHHYQYFGYLNIVASFKYSTIVLREICFPPYPIYIKCRHNTHAEYLKMIQRLLKKGSIIFSEVLENTLSFKDAENSPNLAQKIINLLQQNKSDQTNFRNHIDEMQTKLENLGQRDPDQLAAITEHLLTKPDELHDMLLDIEDSITITKQMITETVVTWNARLNELFHLTKADRTERNRKSRSPQVLPKSPSRQLLAPVEAYFTSPTDMKSPNQSGSSRSPDTKPTSPLERTRLKRASTWSNELASKPADSEPKFIAKPSRVPGTIDEADHLQGPVFCSESLGNMSCSPASLDSPVTSSPLLRYKEVDRLKEDEVKESVEKTEVIDDDNDETKDDGNNESQEVGDELGIDTTDGVLSNSGAGWSTATLVETSRSYEKRSSVAGSAMKNVFINFLTSSNFMPLNSPFPADEHHPSPPCTVVPVIVRDNEPSTIIAYALSCETYKIQLNEMQQRSTSRNSSPGHSNINSTESSPTTKRKLARDGEGTSGSDVSKTMANLTRRTSRVLQFLRTKSSTGLPVPPTKPADDTQLANADAVAYHVTDSEGGNRFPSDTASTNEFDAIFAKSYDIFTGKAEPSPHIEVQFADNNAKFYCRIYYAEEFRKLRGMVFPAGEETFIRSLSACMSWIARGGKSGSRFLKTKDDRFILKQMSRLEFQSFQDFGPHYFKYLTKSYENNKPTALAVILGVFRVGFRNSLTNATLKQDLLIMENLFFDRKMSQIFDLKGSVRNRHVKISGVETGEIVLMDENLLKVMVDSPIYIRPHTKTVLARAVQNDSTFLASHFIMDYSLLVGIDDSTNELVVGIIDYIRTFTWDKKLEMFVKSVGNHGKMPTVLSPELYRTRFREAMDCYFLMVPEYWTGMGKEVQLNL